MMTKTIRLNEDALLVLQLDTQVIGYTPYLCTACGDAGGFIRSLLVWDATLHDLTDASAPGGRTLRHDDPVVVTATAEMRETLRWHVVCDRCKPGLEKQLLACGPTA